MAALIVDNQLGAACAERRPGLPAAQVDVSSFEAKTKLLATDFVSLGREILQVDRMCICSHEDGKTGAFRSAAWKPKLHIARYAIADSGNDVRIEGVVGLAQKRVSVRWNDPGSRYFFPLQALASCSSQ